MIQLHRAADKKADDKRGKWHKGRPVEYWIGYTYKKG